MSGITDNEVNRQRLRDKLVREGESDYLKLSVRIRIIV
jgi:hypothetical protein